MVAMDVEIIKWIVKAAMHSRIKMDERVTGIETSELFGSLLSMLRLSC